MLRTMFSIFTIKSALESACLFASWSQDLDHAVFQYILYILLYFSRAKIYTMRQHHVTFYKHDQLIPELCHMISQKQSGI